jgi:hypothetical protein
VVVSSGGMGHSWKKVENSVGKKTNKQTDGTEDCRVVVRTEHGLKSGVFWFILYMCAPSLLPVRKEIKKGRKRKEERPAKKRASCNRLHLLRRSLCRPSDQPATSTKRPFALPSRSARRVCVCSVYACLSAAAVTCSFPSHYRTGLYIWGGTAFWSSTWPLSCSQTRLGTALFPCGCDQSPHSLFLSVTDQQINLFFLLFRVPVLYIYSAPLFQMWLDVDVYTSFYYYYIVYCWGGFVHY